MVCGTGLMATIAVMVFMDAKRAKAASSQPQDGYGSDGSSDSYEVTQVDCS